MISRSTWLAVGLFLLAVAGALWWTQSDLGAGPELTPTPIEPALWQLTATSVIGLQVEDLESGQVVRARRDPDKIWILEKPPAPLADIGRLERAANAIQVLRPVDSIEASDLTEFGLEEPRYRFQLDLADGRRQTLELGRASPIGSVIYGRLPHDDRVHFIPMTSAQALIDLLKSPPIATPTVDPTNSDPLPSVTP